MFVRVDKGCKSERFLRAAGGKREDGGGGRTLQLSRIAMGLKTLYNAVLARLGVGAVMMTGD